MITFNIFKDVAGFGRDAILPAGLEPHQLVDVTEMRHQFRVFIDPNTGAVHDGNVYHRQQQLAQEITP